MSLDTTATGADGFGHYLEPTAVAIDPQFVAAYEGLRTAAQRHGSLTVAERELIGLAVNAAVTHLNVTAAARHLRRALDAGATRLQVVETLQMTSVLGIHSITVGLPIVLDELGIVLSDRLSDSQEATKRMFVERRGSWSDLWNSVIQVDQEFFEAYLEFSGVPWDNTVEEGGLSPKMRELIYVAIDAATQHLMEPGIRGHARNAIKYGATLRDFLEVLELAALVGMQTYMAGVDELESLTNSPVREKETADV
ncbi:hypothetical protein JCM18899A_38340 [Nocardioides sp. AN3]